MPLSELKVKAMQNGTFNEVSVCMLQQDASIECNYRLIRSKQRKQQSINMNNIDTTQSVRRLHHQPDKASTASR